MRSFIEFGIVAGILLAVAAALGGCAERKASFAPTAPDGRVIPGEHSGSPAMLAGYQTAESGGTQEQSKPAVGDSSTPSSTPAGESPRSSTQVESPPASSQPESSRLSQPVDMDSNGTNQTEQSRKIRGERGLSSARLQTYPSPSVVNEYLQGALASAGTPGGVFNPALGREVAEGSLTAQATITGERGLAASQPTARQTVSGEIFERGTLAIITPASSGNIFRAQRNPSSGPNGACAQLTAAGFGSRNICVRGLKR